MTSLTRRSVTTGLALAVTAIPLAGLCKSTETQPDAELRQLWAKYLPALAALRAAWDICRIARVPYAAEFNSLKHEPRYDRAFGELHRMLWKKHGLNPLAEAHEREHRKLLRIVKAIRKAKAESLFGIGVKLSVLEDEAGISKEELAEVIDGVRRDIAGLTGFDFIAATGGIEV